MSRMMPRQISPHPGPLPKGEGKPRIAFVSPHCLVDFTNGAATATRDGLKLLAAQGFHCMAFCGTRLDEPGEGLIQEQLFEGRLIMRCAGCASNKD